MSLYKTLTEKILISFFATKLNSNFNTFILFIFSTVIILLGMIQYSLVRYYTTSSNTNSNRSTKEYILKTFVICMTIADHVRILSYFNSHLVYGSSLELNSIGNLYGIIGLFVARIIFLWLNYKNEKEKERKK